MTTDTEALPPHPSHATVRDWMPVAEALRLADLWTVGDLDNSGQWRAAIKVLADEVRAALTAAPSAQAQPLMWVELRANGTVRSRSDSAPSEESVEIARIEGCRWVPLYAAPPSAQAQQKTLTDEQIDRIAENCAKAMPDGIQGFCKTWGWRQFARELLDVCAGHVRAPQAAQAQPQEPPRSAPLTEPACRGNGGCCPGDKCEKWVGGISTPEKPPAPSPRLLDLLRRAYEALPDRVDGSLDELFAEIELELGIQPDDGT